MRDKWDEARGDTTYGAFTIANALNVQRDFYEPASANGASPEQPEQGKGTNAPPDRFQLITAKALCALPDPPGSDELAGPLLVRGNRTILGAHTGDGKTSLSLQIVRAVVRGQPFLEWQGLGDCRALVIDAEQGHRTIKRRLRETGLDDCENVDYLTVPDGLSLNSNRADVDGLSRVLAEGRYDVVLADPIYKLHTGDSNAERETVDLMRLFDAWRAEHHFALLLPTHCRKPPMGAKFSMHELFGSSAFLRGAEVVLGLQRMGPGFSRLHYFKDRDGDLPAGEAWGLLFDVEEGFRRDPNDGEPTCTEKVRQALEEQPDQTIDELIAGTGNAKRTVHVALKQLDAEHGPMKPHRYRLPESGEA
jgi:hypothetical protein